MNTLRSTLTVRKSDSPGNVENGAASRGRAPYRAPILDEDSFVYMLSVERKRAERSHRRFVLMLLDTGSLLKHASDQQALGKVLLALSQSTRETDGKGWYDDGNTIGVIFTEVDGAAGRAVASALLARVTAALASTLGIEEINEIRLSFHVFPEEVGGNGDSGRSDPLLYPDLDEERRQKRAARVVKRSIDIAGSLAGLIVFSPLWLLVAAAVKLTSQGPVLFRQERVGQFGKRFTFLKFRSMRLACGDTVHQEFMKSFIAGKAMSENGSGAAARPFKLTNDPRVTAIGRLIRKTSLDELPQFLNVLKGEMSLVGPRPAIPYEVACYEAWQRQRLLAVRPGITGLWQVGGRSRIQFSEMVRLDLKYARTWSTWLDLKILLRTPRAVISGEGAY